MQPFCAAARVPRLRAQRIIASQRATQGVFVVRTAP
jgi:hypothetical protein